MHKIKYLKGLGVGKYIAVGNSEYMLGDITPYTGIRLSLEKIFIHFNNNSPYFGEAELSLNTIDKYNLKNKINNWNGFFLYTSWYKETHYIGIIQPKNSDKFFIKLFKSKQGAKNEAESLNALNSAYGEWFKIPYVKTVDQQLLVLSYLPHTKILTKENGIAIIKDVTSIRIKNNSNVLPIQNLITDTLFCKNIFLESKIEIKNFTTLVLDIQNYISPSNETYKVMLMHGDMTPWNMFYTENNEIALVDSERLAIRSVYSDFIHFIIQPVAVSGRKKVKASYFVETLKSHFQLTEQESKKVILIYFMEELLFDASVLTGSKAFDIFEKSINKKIKWINELISDE